MSEKHKQSKGKADPTVMLSAGELLYKLQRVQGKPPSVMVREVWDYAYSARYGVDTYRVFRQGEEKYPQESWHQAENGVEEYTKAMLRHFLWEIYYPDSEGINDTGLPHMAHAMANAAILYDLMKGK